MERNLMARAAKYLTSQKRRKIGYWTLFSLGAIVVFCTTYALILPAITMSNEPICGKEAHVHDENCFTLVDYRPDPVFICEEWREADVVFHTHTDLCYNSEGDLICPLEERERHVHDESCYVEQRTLICEEPGVEPGEAADGSVPSEPVSIPEPDPAPYIPPHIHTEDCYTAQQGDLICGLEETEGHHHDESCFTQVPTGEVELICGLEESDVMGYDEEGVFHEQIHHHDENCYHVVMEDAFTCGLEETEGHIHTDACYAWEQVLTCGEEENDGTFSGGMREEIPEDAAVPETPEVHVHTDECYEITQVLVCQEEEYQLHTHGPECYETIQVEDSEGGFVDQEVLICQLPVVIEHQHTEACILQAEGEEEPIMERTCGKESHVHDDTCFMPAGPEPDPYFCGLAEHTHTEACYFESGELRCTIPEHVHTEECLDAENFPDPEYPMEIPDRENGEETYVCGLEEHTHEDSCWAEDGTLLCPREEHIHDETCLPEGGGEDSGETGDEGLENGGGTYICGLEEHVHEDSCWAEDGTLLCPREEHIHDETCLPGEDGGEDGGETGPDLEPVLIDGMYEVPADDFVMTFHIGGMAVPVPEEDGQDRNGDPAPPLFQDVVAGVDFPADLEPEPVEDPVPQSTEVQQPDSLSQPEETRDLPADSLSHEPEGETSGGGGRLLSMNLDSPSIPLAALPGGFDGEGVLPLPPVEDEMPMQPESEPWQSEPDPVPQDDEITVELVEVTEGEAYEALMAQVREAEEEDQLIVPPQVMEVVAYRNGQKLDLSDCEITVELKPTQELLDALEGQRAAVASLTEEGGETSETPEDPTEDAGEGTAYSVSVDFFTEGETVQNQVMDPETMKTGDNTMQFSIKRGARFARAAKFTPNPKFQVQFYVNIDIPLSDNKVDEKYSLPFIDTSAAANGGEKATLPVNGDKNLKQKYLNLSTDNSGAVVFNRQLRELYLPDEREFNPKLEDQLNINYLNSLRLNDHYAMAAVWILKDGKDPSSTNEADWEIKTGTLESLNSQLKFTNNPDAASADAGGNTILVKENTVIRLVYEANTGSYFIDDAAFYDYDVSNGIYKTVNGVEYIDARYAGINTGVDSPRLAFGNSHDTLLTGHGEDKMPNGQTPNKANSSNFGGCTFGLAKDSLDANGNIQFNLPAPDLFTNGEQKGKTGVPNINQLNFKRQGDTYTLSSVEGTDAKNLENFGYVRGNWNNTKKIWSNNFWPMDKSPVWGAKGHDIKFGDVAKAKQRQFVKELNDDGSIKTSASLPTSDFGYEPNKPGEDEKKTGKDHNAYFGMHFAVDFTLTKEYIGPLEYYFYGDDDMWVYLTYPNGTSKLICDIGGVHSSVGEYADLWDYIEKTDKGSAEGTYRLSFFYTERGASGSTCWMQFTLPQLSMVEVTPPYNKETAGLRIKKEVEGLTAEELENKEFKFQLTLDGVMNLYEMKFYDADDNQIGDTETISGSAFTKEKEFTLKHGQYVDIIGLPLGTYYIIEELFDENNSYHTHIDNNGTHVNGVLATGAVTGSKDEEGHEIVSTTTVTYTNIFAYSLPATGGPSALTYTLGGALLLTAAAGCLLYRTRSRRRGAVDGT